MRPFPWREVVIAALVLVVAFGVHRQQVADARASERITAEREARESRAEEEKVRKADEERRNKETQALLQSLEEMKKQKATPDNTLAVLAALRSKPEIITVPVPTSDPGKPGMPKGEQLPDAPGLMFRGDSLTDLRNFGLSCQQCDIDLRNERAKVAKRDEDVKQRDADIAGLRKSLDASQKAQGKTKWSRTREWLIRAGIAYGSYQLGKASQ